MNIALISEGVSEHKIIKHIVSKYLKDKEPFINQIQPKIVNNKQEAVGGWNEVLKYCERPELQQILVENDYLIIQVDSDQSQQSPFSISHTKPGGSMKTDAEIHSDIVDKLKEIIKPGVLMKYGDKIFFAICIHTIECWLLPIYYTDTHKAKTTNCLDPLNKALRKKNINTISGKNKNNINSQIAYNEILKNFKKQKEIIDYSEHNEGFKKFIDSLKSIEQSSNNSSLIASDSSF